MPDQVKFIIPFLMLSLLISCKSFDNTILEQKEYIDNSVHPMKIVINQPSVEQFCNKNKFITSSEVTNTLKQNLAFKSDTSNIYLSVIIRKSEITRISHFYELLLLMVPVILGAPMDTATYTITLEAAVMNHSGKIFRTYTSSGVYTEFLGGTGNFTLEGIDGLKTSYIKALQSACTGLRAQLKNDTGNINKLVL